MLNIETMKKKYLILKIEKILKRNLNLNYSQ